MFLPAGPFISSLTNHPVLSAMDAQQTPPTASKRQRRAATVAGQERQAHQEAKFAILEHVDAEEELGDPL